MRDEDLEYRPFTPLWRRIMIVLAVIAAVPVVLWSITAFVRTYVEPPKVPTFRPIAAAASTEASGGATTLPTLTPARTLAAIARNVASEEPNIVRPAPAPIVEASATVSDTRGLPSVATLNEPRVDSSLAEASTASIGTTRPPIATMIPMLGTAPGSMDASAPAPRMADPLSQAAAPTGIAVAEPHQPPGNAGLEGEALVGPVPLPPHRPRSFAMAPSGIPVPRPRPGAAAESASIAPVSIGVDVLSHDYVR